MTVSDDLAIPALGAMASARDGWMTLSDLTAHLATRQGPTEPEAADANSPESRSFDQQVKTLLDELVGQGFATADETGARFAITDAGRAFIGR